MMRNFVVGGLMAVLLVAPSTGVQAAPGEQVVAQAPLKSTGPDGGADLGPLKGTRGTHDYPVPAGTPVDLKGGAAVLVYCHAFNVAFGNATLLSSG